MDSAEKILFEREPSEQTWQGPYSNLELGL